MYTKKNSRNTYKSSRRPIYKKNIGYQNSKGRNRGNVSQQYNKYLKLAKESSRSGDRIQSEYYYQFTDHYYRLMVELGINIEDNTQTEETKQLPEEQSSDQTEGSNIDSNEEKSENDSLESIPFIAEPSKEKRTR
mgnify:CR=1 FL=1|tara:strand:- start:162 stop:566 length:405 start_codon:yes stop_codon:yes gene_type:complete